MSNKKNVLIFTGIYFALRIFSYFFSPGTPLEPTHWLNNATTLALILTTAYLLIRGSVTYHNNPISWNFGWSIIAFEIILGGSGSFLTLGGITLRTWLLGISLTIFFIHKLLRRNFIKTLSENTAATVIIATLLAIVGLGIIRGLLNDHDTHLVIADAIPYLFLLYYFPLRERLRDQQFVITVTNALIATIIGNTLLVLGTLVVFSTDLTALQGTFYHWFRDVAGGKITELPFHFYRIVLNEHLLFIPLALIFIAHIIHKKSIRLYSSLTFLLLIILSLNLTRSYLLALVVGLAALAIVNRANWKRALVVSVATLVIFILTFIGLHLVASRGQSLGLEIFGLRLQSIVSPTIEDSSLSRVLLLPPIMEEIKTAPFIGRGLGDIITVYSPVEKRTITTSQFDWGYLEIVAELGAIGLLIWLTLLFLLWRAARHHTLSSAHLTSLLALLVINLTSPALFHVLGIIWLMYLLSVQEGASVKN